ncbi:site-specific DNA-methyltransferase [Microbacterium sp. SLBN-111]|uniref:site-specific DNA-methyltransferase n=1 Tax=Microbacterium sp. SLBN-111 TaxID=3377733 RepID=UPI003C775EFF
MARPRPPKGPTQVTAYDHDDKRSNIPTADAAATFYDEVKEALPPKRYPRNVDLDPQLVWKGKDEQDDGDLIIDAPPIYIEEKIAPQALIENLTRQSSARRSDDLPSLFDFDDFDELKGLENVEFYRHEESWKNRMILGDSLRVMGSLAQREALRGKVQMVYIDPPYGIKFGSNWQVRTDSRNVRDGNMTDAAREAEQIKAFRDTWQLGIHSYLAYLRDRLMAARELLTDSGSVFVQIGDENVHLVRSLLDETFGAGNFVSQIKFASTSGFAQATALGRAGDYVLWYAKNIDQLKSRPLWRKATERQAYNWVELPDGSRRGISRQERIDPTLLPPGARPYTPGDMQSQGASSSPQPFEHRGRRYLPGASAHWKANYPAGMERLAWANRIHVASNSIRYVRYADDFGYQPYNNTWTDTATGNFTDDKIYVVQTGSKVIERCMLLTTDPGDLVLDPTCGSGTTAFVAEQWGRRWITIDTSRVALALARQRVAAARYPFYLLADSDEGRRAEQLTPKYTAGDLRQGFVYEKIQRITLGSIANNPDIHEGMARDEIEAAVKKHADFELLYDRPLEDSRKVRVAGPFTVESLSPHRSLSFEDADELRPGAMDADSPPFEQSILANLRVAGIQNGRKAERLVFSSLEGFPGAYVQALGVQENSDESIAIAIGPQYGTVSAGFIKQAAREAVDAGAPVVAVLGFAFDPQLGVETDEEGFAVVAGVRDLGRVRVLVVRMNADLLMGDELRNTDKANLFTVFGEPDLVLRASGPQWEVEVRGVDVYDPTSGEVRSNSTSEIALWMIDTDYDGESFFVRHAYFLGDNDPYKALKTALKADIDPDAWATLYRPVSVPFDTPSTGKIAIKVINDYGDEVMKVLEVS